MRGVSTKPKRLSLTGIRPKDPLKQAEKLQQEVVAERADLSDIIRRCRRPHTLREYRRLLRRYRQMPPGKEKRALGVVLDQERHLRRCGSVHLVWYVLQRAAGWR